MNNKFNSISPFLQSPLQPNNIIVYESPSKLQYVSGSYSGGIHTKRFGKAKLIKHTFKNGIGTLKFDKEVTEIPMEAFKYANITNIKLPNSIIKLSKECFSSCNLTSIDLGDNLQIIEELAFYNNPLETLIIPDSVTTIGTNFINNYSHYTLRYLKLGKGIKDIKDLAFRFYSNSSSPVTVYINYKNIGTEWYNNSAYINLIIGPNVETIAQDAFRSRSSIQSIIIGKNVKTIGANAFQYCSSIKIY